MNPENQVKRFDFARAKWDEFQIGIGDGLGVINGVGSTDEFNDLLSKMNLNVALKMIPCRL